MDGLQGLIFVLFLVFVFNEDVIDASEPNSDSNHNLKYLLKRRSRSLDFQGPSPDPLWRQPNRRIGFDGEGPNSEFYPDYGYPNSNAGSNNNKGNAAESNKQYGWGNYNQNSGVFNSQSNGGNPSNRPNQNGGQGNSNNRPNQGSAKTNSSSKLNQGNGGFSGQSNKGSSSQNSGVTSSSQSINGGSNSPASGGSTSQRPPLNIILNENTLDNSTIRECIQNKCSSTNEYNPVCGDDNITYQNPTKFKCAQFCKSGVKMSYRGSCVTTPSPN